VPLSDDPLISVSDLFFKHGIKFCVAGGWAVSIWGAVRATEDIDLVVLTDPGDHEAIRRILEIRYRVISHPAFFFAGTHTPVWRNVLTAPDIDDHCVLDIIIATTDYVKATVERAVFIEYREVSLPIIALEDLIILKAMAGRTQDRADIEALLKGTMPLDTEYLIRTARGLGVDVGFLSG